LNLVLAPFSLGADKVSPDAKHEVQMSGTGHKVNVKMKDGTLLKGTLTGFDDSSFTVDKGKAKGVSTLSYADVASVQRDGLSTGAKVGIGVGLGVVGIGAGVGIYAAAALHGLNNPGCLTGGTPPNCAQLSARKP
jgi:hypothetical protein